MSQLKCDNRKSMEIRTYYIVILNAVKDHHPTESLSPCNMS
jgi:hypothetical protein